MIDCVVLKPFRRNKPRDIVQLTRQQAKVMIAIRKVKYLTRDMQVDAPDGYLGKDSEPPAATLSDLDVDKPKQNFPKKSEQTNPPKKSEQTNPPKKSEQTNPPKKPEQTASGLSGVRYKRKSVKYG